jgi:hypothetical protein
LHPTGKIWSSGLMLTKPRKTDDFMSPTIEKAERLTFHVRDQEAK